MSTPHVVISGGGRGIGLELVRQSLENGSFVTALVRNPSGAEDLKSLQKKNEGRLTILACDVTLGNDIVQARGELMKKGAIDLLINNAGAYPKGDDDFEALDFKKVRDTFETNTFAPMRLAQALLPLLLKSKNPKLANITSLMGSIADNESGGSYAYRTSKAALNMFTKSFAIDYPQITSLTLHPGWVRTDMGGSQAPTLPEESARGLLKVIHAAKSSESGRFYDFEGDVLPW